MKNRLVAHRGDIETYPENSLLALCSAAKLGFDYIELDIQFSKNVIPIVIHDENLVRTAGINKNVYASTTKELMLHRILSPIQDDESKALLNIATLDKAVEVLNNYPDIILFVEIKRQSLEHFDLALVVDTVLNYLKEAKFNVVIISFVKEIIEYVKLQKGYSTGWILSKYNNVNKAIVNEIQPDYLFCNVKKINDPSGLWKGPWKWVLYDIKNPAFAYELLEQGVDLIETGDIVKLSDSEYFK